MAAKTGRGIWALAALLILAQGGTSATASETPPVAPADIPVVSFSGAYLAGRAAEDSLDHDAAITFYEKALDFAPDNLGIHRALVLSHLAAGNVEAALPHAERVKDEPEIDRLARLALGIDAIKARQFSDAQNILALSEPSDLDRLVNGLMRAWAMAGANGKDAALAELAALEGPTWFEPFKAVNAASILEMLGDDAAARTAYAAVMADQSGTGAAPDAWLRALESYATLLARLGEKDEALAIVDRGIEVAPERPMLRELRTMIESDARPKPLIATPTRGAAEALFSLAMAINRDGAEMFVRRFIHLSLHLSPGNDLFLYELARVEERNGQHEAAVRFFEAIDDSSSLHTLAWMQAALNLAELERNEEAKERLRAVIAEEPDNRRAYLALGAIFARAEDFRSAATLYDQALAANPDAGEDFWTIHYQRGIAYERLKEWPTAEAAFREALARNPDQPQVLNYLGYSLIDQNMKLDEAIEMVRRAVELSPQDGYIVDSLGWAYYKLGDYENAVEHLTRAVNLSPGDAVINDHLGDAFWHVGRKLESRFQWNHALALDPEPELKQQLLRKIETGMPLDAENAEETAGKAGQADGG